MPTKTYLFDYVNDRKYLLNDVLPPDEASIAEAAKRPLKTHGLLKAPQLPPKVDLRPSLTAIEQQYQTSSCVANALAGAYEYLLNRATGAAVDVSRLFLYFNARVRRTPPNYLQDRGCAVSDGVMALAQYGTCLESLWPFEARCLNAQPPAEAYQAASEHKIVEYYSVAVDLVTMKTCLAQGYPFAFGAKLFNSFNQGGRTGAVPMPSAQDGQLGQHGLHCMLAVGYSDLSQMFIIRNSWGTEWGDQGYGYMPYAYLTNPDLISDVWTIRKLATDNFNQDGWSYDDNINYGANAAGENDTGDTAEPGLLRANVPKLLKKGEILEVEEPDDSSEAPKETEAVTTTEPPAATSDS